MVKDAFLSMVNRVKNVAIWIGNGVSTSSSLRKVAKAYDVKSRLLLMPASFIQLAAKSFGKRGLFGGLLKNFKVDPGKLRKLFDCKPVVTIFDQLKRVLDWIFSKFFYGSFP